MVSAFLRYGRLTALTRGSSEQARTRTLSTRPTRPERRPSTRRTSCSTEHGRQHLPCCPPAEQHPKLEADSFLVAGRRRAATCTATLVHVLLTTFQPLIAEHSDGISLSLAANKVIWLAPENSLPVSKIALNQRHRLWTALGTVWTCLKWVTCFVRWLIASSSLLLAAGSSVSPRHRRVAGPGLVSGNGSMWNYWQCLCFHTILQTSSCRLGACQLELLILQGFAIARKSLPSAF